MVHSQKLTDEKLLKAFQAGEPAAFKRFLQLNFLSWVNYAKDLLQNKLHSEEVALEAFSKVWQAKKNFFGFNNVNAFVILSIDRTCRDYLSRIVEENRSVIPGIKKPPKYHRYNSRKNRRWLVTNEKWLLSLPLRERQIFILHYFAEVDNSKIANLMGTNTASIRYLLKSANEKLRDLRKRGRDRY
ncbi:RNA polymerase sigma factor [Pseudoflavitalea rhizosphaerae]|uniref:RNA polymerase sigma factor n=1 Tax=Pseudoflavitalea rhizosphaerae TaxID=1884793 RepID=UPI0013DF4FC3|nr:sigma-70 family RNA polymerase sigma factor [Pseudoflavitalea rhizosphaerae]